MKTSRAVFSEVQKKAGAFPFNIRVFEDEKKARLGLQEAVQHGLVKPYEVMWVKFTFQMTVVPSHSSNQLHADKHIRRRVPFHHRPAPCRPPPTYSSTIMVQARARQDREGS